MASRCSRWAQPQFLGVVLLLCLVAGLQGTWTTDVTSPPLRCPGVNPSVVPPLPISRRYKLRAEAKSGTTWFQKLLFDVLLEICDTYDQRVEGITCEALCTAMNRRIDQPCGKRECPLRNLSFCRQVIVRMNDSRALAPDQKPLTRTIEVDVGDKHVVPFIQSDDHPNRTPVKRGLPSWLEECILRNEYACVPPLSSLKTDLGLSPNQTRQVLSDGGVYFPVDMEWSHARDRLTAKKRVPGKAAGILTIFRDPRSVAVSAAHYAPGMNLFGAREYNERQHVNEFVRGTINMTSGWIQFRRHWFSLINTSGVVPVFSTFYEV